MPLFQNEGLMQALLAGQVVVPRPRTVQDLYEEALRRGENPYSYDPRRMYPETPIPDPTILDTRPPSRGSYELPMPPAQAPAAPNMPELPAGLPSSPQLPEGVIYNTAALRHAQAAARGGVADRPIMGMGQAYMRREELSPSKISDTQPFEPSENMLGQMLYGAVTPSISEANPEEYLAALQAMRDENTARIAGVQQAEENAGFGLLPAEEGTYRLPNPSKLQEAMRLRELMAGRGGQEPLVGVPGEKDAPEETGPMTGAEEVARGSEFPIQVEEPGDLKRAKIMKRLANLTAFRDIAEGLGRPIPVKGNITTGYMPKPFRAEGIREAIGREDERLKALDVEDRVRLQEKLRAQTEEKRFQNRQDLEEQRQMNRIELAAFNRKIKGTPIKPLPIAGVDRLNALEHLSDELKKVLNEVGNYNTGPVIDTVESVLEFFIGQYAYFPSGGRKAGFKSMLRNILNQYVKATQGARPSDFDLKFLSKVTPQASDDNVVLVDKAKRLLQWTQKNRGRVEDYYRASGYTLPEGESETKAQPQADMVTVQIPGHEPRPIPRSRLADFQRDYPDASVNAE